VSVSGLRRMFYIITPEESSFATLEEVPDYVFQAVPFFTIFGLLEQFLYHVTGKGHKFPVNDGLTSVGQGVIMDLVKLITISCEITAYVWAYNRINIINLPWDSPLTWWLCFLGVDLGYYWFHRAAHEVNIMWAGHQVHHSSEYYNLSTALRQSLLQQFTSWMFYLPLALAIPPPMFLAHIQFNLIFQFWIHVGFVGKLGPLEYIINTPSHHRVHHGRNRSCIDKNYAGSLIIWDRMFGTFEAENEEVVYGLTHPINSFNPFTVQFAHLSYIIQTVRETSGIGNKLSVIFKGPGWGPGKPRLGNIEDIPDVHAPVAPYNPVVPTWWSVYIYIHNMITVLGSQELHVKYGELNQFTVLLFASFIILSLTAFGGILENKNWGGALEIFRCVLFIGGSRYFASGAPPTAEVMVNFVFLRILELFFVASALIWTLHYTRFLRITLGKYIKSE